MKLLMVDNAGEKYLLHDGKNFLMSDDEKDVQRLADESSDLICMTGGFQVVEISTNEQLVDLIGKKSYEIFHFQKISYPFGVRIINNQESENVI